MTYDNMIRRIRIALWIPKATSTHSEYIILIAFPPQRRLHEHSKMLRYTYSHTVKLNMCSVWHNYLFVILLFWYIIYYIILYYIILYYIILHTVLYCTILYYTTLHYITLHYTTLHYTVLYYTILYYTIPLLYYIILYYIILYYISKIKYSCCSGSYIFYFSVVL
jgi:hypothetical protein